MTVMRVFFSGFFAVLFCLGALCGGAVAADAQEWGEGLTDRELAIQQWYSRLTFMQGHESAWEGWHDDGKQMDVTAFRYQFAFGGYGCAAMAARTPAYRDLAQRQLRDLCERMVDRRTWFYVTAYWNYGDNPPDPCLYENVMYTGHLTQLMALYEHLTGDFRYSMDGWDFVWEDGRKTHYTLDKAVRGLRDQSKASPTGGICCEPGLVFSACNAHSAASFVLHDMLHGTDFAGVNQRWFEWMSVNFRNKVPLTREFLYAIYDQGKGFFYPVGDVGGDCWTLGFGHPWFPDTSFTKTGWKHICQNAAWVEPADGQCYAKHNKVVGCCGGSSLSVANSFIPLTGVQAEGKDSPRARGVLNWLEATYGKALDMDGDGHEESYCYEVCPMHRISSTGIIAAALATDGDSMRDFYRTSRDGIRSAPTLASVDYPNVLVRAAEYREPLLCFVVLKGRPGFSGDTELVCSQIPENAEVLRDGAAWTRFTRDGGTLRITSDVDSERVFEVRCGGG